MKRFLSNIKVTAISAVLSNEIKLLSQVMDSNPSEILKRGWKSCLRGFYLLTRVCVGELMEDEGGF